MSIFCTVDRSSIGSVIKIVPRRQFSAFELFDRRRQQSELCRTVSKGKRLSHSTVKHTSLDIWFVNALVTAGECRQHVLWRSRFSRECQIFNSNIKSKLGSHVRTYHYQNSTTRRPSNHHFATTQEPSTREELLALVDQYDNNSLTDHLPVLKPPSLKQHTLEPDLVISNEEQDERWPTQRYVWPAQGEEQIAIHKLETALKVTSMDSEDYYKLYRALPAPRVPYLSASARHKLLNKLGVLERKDEQAMLRYLSVLDDMKALAIPLTKSEWNIAISFAGRYVARTGEAEVEGALRVWREMEHVANIRANAATFNILFDVATKAGKYRLGEMIYKEMENRGYSFNRFHHVSLIHYHGLRADGENVRKAYKALIDAGEIVDTVVLNCMIRSLIRSYEPQAAMQIYERMKKLHEGRIGHALPSRNYRTRREITKTLVKLAEVARRQPKKLQTFQDQSIIAPDIKTYSILIQYVAVVAGELHRTAQLLDEMRWFDVPSHGSIFLALFKAFSIHGGVRYSLWTLPRLESVWKAYILAVDGQHEHVYMGKWMVFWALKAFKSCAGNQRTMEAWEEIKDKWSPQDDEAGIVATILAEK